MIVHKDSKLVSCMRPGHTYLALKSKPIQVRTINTTLNIGATTTSSIFVTSCFSFPAGNSRVA